MNWWKRFRKARERSSESESTTVRLRQAFRSWHTAFLATPLVLLVALHVALFPPARSRQSFALDEGSITSHEIVAPFTFTSPRAQAELAAARREAAQRVEPVYRVLPGAEERTEQRLRDALRQVADNAPSDSLSVRPAARRLADRFPTISEASWIALLTADDQPALRRGIEQTVRRNLAAGIADTTPRGTYQMIQILFDERGGASARDISSVVLAYQLPERLLTEFNGLFQDRTLAQATAELARSVLMPNLSYDDQETEHRRNQAAATVPTVREYARNERILDAGVRVTQDDAVILEELSKEQAVRERAQDATIGIRLQFGRILTLGCLFVGFILLLPRADRQLLRAPNRWLLVCLLFALYLVVSAFLLAQSQWAGPFAVPVVLLGMLATILFGEQVGTRAVIVGILLLAMLPGSSPGAIVVWAVGGATACQMVRRVRHRNQFYKAMIVITCALGISVSGVAFAEGHGFQGTLSATSRALGSAIACTALTLFLLPLFEALFGVTTELTLLELGDLNHPLLRRMSLESPGTYHHSQVVGTLAEAGTGAIGANSLAARVGANFHDIGKMLKPRYYVENQLSENPHDELTPTMSALVIAAHVRDGLELGRQWGLPREVLDFIPEHHGTGVMQYFYRKALERDDGKSVMVDDFRYPGPKPQSRETAVVMLADGVEASTRSLRRMTPSRIREMVRKIIDKRVAEGELDECGLSLSDLAQIREAFVPILVGIHHERLAYPGQLEHEERKERESNEARARNRRGGSTMATGG